MPRVYSLAQVPKIRVQKMKLPPMASRYYFHPIRLKGTFQRTSEFWLMFSVQMTTESPVQVEPLKTPVSAKKHRRKLFLSNEKTNDENKAQKSLNESFEGNITHNWCMRTFFFFDFERPKHYFSTRNGKNFNTLTPGNAPWPAWTVEQSSSSVAIVRIWKVTESVRLHLQCQESAKNFHSLTFLSTPQYFRLPQCSESPRKKSTDHAKSGIKNTQKEGWEEDVSCRDVIDR